MTEQQWRIKFRVQNYDRMQSHVKDCVKDYVWYVRLVPEADLVFAKMQQLVEDLYAGLEKRQKVAFGFQDEDGDICILSSQDVLDGLLRMQKDKRSLRLVLIPNYAVAQDQKNDDNNVNNDEKVGPSVLRNDGKSSISTSISSSSISNSSSSSSSSISISKQKDAIDDRGDADVKCGRDYRNDRDDRDDKNHRSDGDVGNVDKEEEDKHADTKDEDKHGDKKDHKGSSDCMDSYKVVTGLLDDREATWAKIRASPFQESATQALAQLTTIRKIENKLTSVVACDLIRNGKLAEGVNEGNEGKQVKEVKENIDKLKAAVKDFETSWQAAHALSHDYKKHIDCLAKIDCQIVACCNQLLQECMQKYRQNKKFKLRVLRRKGNSTQWYLDSVTQLARVNSTGDNGEHVVQFESDQKWCVYLPFGPSGFWCWIPLFNDCEEITRQVLHIQNQGRN